MRQWLTRAPRIQMHMAGSEKAIKIQIHLTHSEKRMRIQIHTADGEMAIRIRIAHRGMLSETRLNFDCLQKGD